MHDEEKTREQLLEENQLLRQKVSELMRIRAMLKSVLDNSSTVIFLKDIDGHYLMINRRYEELFGITKEEIIDRTMVLIGKQVSKMVKKLDVQVEPALPRIMMNAGKIEQVLINLVINAGQAADKEDSWVRVSARRSKNKPGYVELLVEDNGEGIPPDIVHQVFDPFFTTKGRDAGTGLGLAISQRTVEEHGGALTVASAAGASTCFTMCLPICEEPRR